MKFGIDGILPTVAVRFAIQSLIQFHFMIGGIAVFFVRLAAKVVACDAVEALGFIFAIVIKKPNTEHPCSLAEM